MEITEIRIKLMEESGERLQAFCSITFDDAFVIRDLKIIDGTNGPFVAMPSRKLTAHCPQCHAKNHLRAQFCNQCGSRQRVDRAALDEDGRAKLYADIAHPINSACREMIQECVIREFYDELDRVKQPGYVSSYDDFDHEDSPTHRRDLPPRSFERSQLQPAEQRIRGPHRNNNASASPPHTTQRLQSAPSQPVVPPPRAPGVKPDQGGFGAGIF